jgi:hypothetical protein
VELASLGGEPVDELAMIGGRGLAARCVADPWSTCGKSPSRVDARVADDAGDVRREGRGVPIAAMTDGRLVAAVGILLGRGDVAQDAAA